MANESNFMNDANIDSNVVDQLNKELEDDEINMLQLVELDPDFNPYKESLLNCFRDIEDPFGIEIMGQTGGASFDQDQINSNDGKFFDYMQNPAEPSQPQKKVQISEYVGKNWE